jgi:alanine dehydrogenase
MSYLTTGVIATSRKENEARLPIHPRQLDRIPAVLREYLVFEQGYGSRFGSTDEALEASGFRTAERREILTKDLVLLPKVTAEDLQETKKGGIVWGWPHCVQQREVTQVAIDRRLTLIAWEAMYHWGSSGDRQLHSFYKNNELAGYCSVLHALELMGWDGFYGPARHAVVLGFGSVSRGAVSALRGRGVDDIAVYTQRPSHLVGDQILGCSYHQMSRPAEPGGGMTTSSAGEPEVALIDVLASAEIIVNGTLQDTDRPLDYLRSGEETRLRPGTLIVDVSCDEGMGFPFAKPTSFEEPAFQVNEGQLTYYAVDHSPSYLWDAATWEISEALLPYLDPVMSGPAAWATNPTIDKAVEIREGTILNPRILSFQERAAEYPHPTGDGS